MKKLSYAAITISCFLIFTLQACSESTDTDPVIRKDIPIVAPKEIVKIAPPPPALILPQGKKAMIDMRLSQILGLTTSHKTNYSKTYKSWSLECGDALAENGTGIDFQKSKVKQQAQLGMMENNYCALFQEQDGQNKLLEFEYGQTDSHTLVWLIRHNVPKELLK